MHARVGVRLIIECEAKQNHVRFVVSRGGASVSQRAAAGPSVRVRLRRRRVWSVESPLEVDTSAVIGRSPSGLVRCCEATERLTVVSGGVEKSSRHI